MRVHLGSWLLQADRGHGQAGPRSQTQGEVRNLLMAVGGERELRKGPAL